MLELMFSTVTFFLYHLLGFYSCTDLYMTVKLFNRLEISMYSFYLMRRSPHRDIIFFDSKFSKLCHNIHIKDSKYMSLLMESRVEQSDKEN